MFGSLLRKRGKKKRVVYLDYAATTPVADEAILVMRPYYQDQFYNPSALYKRAVIVREAIEMAREKLAKQIGALTDEIIFTGGATETNHLVVDGVIAAAKAKGITAPEIIISAIEHPSVRNICRQREQEGGITLKELPVDTRGCVDPKALRQALSPETIFVSIHYINNEIGTQYPIPDYVKAIRHHKKEHNTDWPLFHTDASQAGAVQALHMSRLGVDFMTLSSQKAYGPKGLAILVKRRGVPLENPRSGGGHESGYRPGTENVPAILGGVTALVSAQQQATSLRDNLKELRAWCLPKLQALSDRIIVHGGDGLDQSPHILNFSILGINGELVVIELDERGVACSARAACSIDDAEASHVLAGIYAGNDRKQKILATGSVRWSFGKHTTKDELRYALAQVQDIIAKYKD